MVSLRLRNVPESPIRKLVPYAMKAIDSGVHVYHLNIGNPDVKTPDVMVSVLTKWKKNPIEYGQSQGEPALLEALLSYYHSLGYPYIERKYIQVTSGGSEAIFMAMFAATDPGDELLVFEPFYTNYLGYAATTGITLKPIPTNISDGFHLPKEMVIERAISKKTKGILICSPNNPTGTVYSKEEIEMLVHIVKKHNVFLFSDEVYREYTYDGTVHASILPYMQEMPQQLVLLDSLSKRYSLCGARVGCLVSLNTELMDGVLRIAQSRLAAGTIDQAIASKLTEVSDTHIRNVRKEYEKRRDILYDGLRSIPGMTIPKPEGAFYVIAGLPVFNAEDFCRWLLTDFRDNNETVMLAPADGFYATPGKGKNEVRIAYVINSQAIKRSVEILRKALKTYGKR